MKNLSSNLQQSNWKMRKISEVYGFTRKRRELRIDDDAEVPFVPMELIPQGGQLGISHRLKRYSEITSGTYFEKGDLLLSKITPSFENGKQGIADDIPGSFGYASTELIPIKEIPGVSNKLYLFYYLLHSEVRHAIAERMEGSTGRQRVPEALIRDWKIPFPPLEQQEEIVAVLKSIQDAIAVEIDLLRVTRELKQAVMKKLFTEGLRGEPQKQAEIGLVPESWEINSLSSFFNIRHGYAFEGKYFASEGDHILMTPGHFSESGGYRDQGKKTKFYVGPIPEGYLLQEGDLLIAMTEQKAGLIGSPAFVPQSDRFLHNQRLGLVVNIHPSLNKRFLFHLMNTDRVRSDLGRTSTGSKVKHTSPTKILSLVVAIPVDVGEQARIAQIIDAIDNSMALRQDKLQSLRQFFDCALRNLMSGEPDVTTQSESETCNAGSSQPTGCNDGVGGLFETTL